MSDKMSGQSVAFKLIKSVYIVVLVVGLIGSGLLFVFGLYALRDGTHNNNFYKNVMKYYGINEINFEPILNETNSVRVIDINEQQNLYGVIMVFVALTSIVFESIALVGAVRDSLVITVTVVGVMIVSTISGLFTTKTLDLCSVATQSLFILLAAVYVILLKKDLSLRTNKSENSTNGQICKAV